MELRWRECGLTELAPLDLYKILKLRSAVFVLEQQCIYEDIDGRDGDARHLIGSVDEMIVAYARLFAPGRVHDGAASIGRVLTARAYRGAGAGQALMREAISAVERIWGRVPIRIGAQAYLERFYSGFGFLRAGENYMEDGIAHLPMRREP